MTSAQHSLVHRLRKCRILGTWESSFIRSMAERDSRYQLSFREIYWLARLQHRFRSQLLIQEVAEPRTAR